MFDISYRVCAKFEKKIETFIEFLLLLDLYIVSQFHMFQISNLGFQLRFCIISKKWCKKTSKHNLGSILEEGKLLSYEEIEMAAK